MLKIKRVYEEPEAGGAIELSWRAIPMPGNPS